MADVREYLHSKGFEFIEKDRPSGLNALMVCPFCGGDGGREQSFAINLATGAWNCNRKNHCGLAGSFYRLREKLGDVNVRHDKPDRYFVNRKKPQKRVYTLPQATPQSLSSVNLKYLANRGFSKEIIEQFKLFNGKMGEICFPYFRDGKMVNIKHRTLQKKMWQEPDAESCLYNRDAVQGSDILIITEGECDCMALTQYGYRNVTSLPTGTNDHRWVENEWEWLGGFQNIYLCMDADTAGGRAVDLLVSKLGRWRCSSVVFPEKDANDCLKAGLAKQALDGCFQEAQEFPPAILKSSGQYYEEVCELNFNQDKYNGVPTGFDGLNYYLGGWRKGEVTIWSGQNNAGKSTFLNEVCLFLASQHIRSCIASLEMRPARYLNWMVHQAVGKETLTVEEISETMAWTDQWIFVMDTVQEGRPDEMLEVFEYAAKRYGVEHFVIDSLMKMDLRSLDRDKYDAQGIFVKHLTDFAKEFQSHIHLIAHPRKSSSDIDTPGKVDISGSGDITNLADNVLILWRNTGEDKDMAEPDAVLYVKKNRETGKLGAIKLYFNSKTKRFSCQDQCIDFYIGQ